MKTFSISTLSPGEYPSPADVPHPCQASPFPLTECLQHWCETAAFQQTCTSIRDDRDAWKHYSYISAKLYMHCRRAVLAEIELSSVGMNDIFEREGLTVTDVELKAEVDSVTAEFGRNGQAFDKERLEEQAMEVLKVGHLALQAVPI